LGAERKIQSERIDFVVCDGSLVPKTIIELDGGRKRQKERDEFVEAAMQAAEFKVIQLKTVNPDELSGWLAE
jgi:very-short-patch-repair endonuclease